MKTSTLLALASASLALANPIPDNISFEASSAKNPFKAKPMDPYPNTTPARCPISLDKDVIAPDLVFKISEVDHKVHPLAWVDPFIHVRKKLHTFLEFNLPVEWNTEKRQCSLWIRTPAKNGFDEEFKVFANGSMGFNAMESGAKVDPLIQTWSKQPKAKWTLGMVALENFGTIYTVNTFPCPDVAEGRWTLRLNSEHRLDVVLPQTNNSDGGRIPTGVFLSSCDSGATQNASMATTQFEDFN